MKSIIFVQYTDPSGYPPLEHSSLMLADRGISVTFLGTKAGGAASELELPFHAGISVLRMPARPRGWRQILHYVFFLVWCRSEVKRRRPDVVYCSDAMSYPVGLWASGLPNVRTVLHEHDPPPSEGGGHVTRLLRSIRRRFARRASVIVIPQAERARRFIDSLRVDPSSVHVTFNCPSRREIENVQPARCDARQATVLWYHGALGPGLLPLTVVEALARLPSDIRLEMAGYETVSCQGYVSHLLARARELGVADRVRNHGALHMRADLLRAASTADIGLALFANEFRDPMVGASNKPFDYLACGLPLLTNKTAEWEEFFGVEGVSTGCDPENPDDIARAILILRNDPVRCRQMVEAGRRLIATRWNYEAQFEPVIAALEAGLPRANTESIRAIDL